MLSAADGKKNVLDAVLLGKSDGMRSSECEANRSRRQAAPATALSWSRHRQKVSCIRVHLQPLRRSLRLNRASLVFRSQRGKLHHRKSCPQVRTRNFRTPNFDAVRLANPSQLQFRYKLDGYDRAWTTSLLREARYQNLPPGTYRFFIAARDEGHDWGNPSNKSLWFSARSFINSLVLFRDLP